MSDLSVVETDPFKEMEKVASMMLKGHSEYTTARRLNMKAVEVRALWSQYKERLTNDSMATDVARDHLNLMVKQYDSLIAKANQNLEDLESLTYDEKISAQINATIKTIGDLQAKRVDTLQKAGLLDAGELGEELAQREEREQQLLNILRNDLCADCKVVVRDKLTAMSSVVEGTVVND